MSIQKQEATNVETAIVDLDMLTSALKTLNPIMAAAAGYAKLQEKERQKEAKLDEGKVTEFAGYVYPIYAAHVGTKGEMLNRIFDNNEIDSAEKGFLMREMAIAIKRTIPEYRDKPTTEMMNVMSQWIYDANKLRVATKAGSKIHCTEKGGHYKFRWHILNYEGDYEKQRENLTVRVQSADKTLENRADEWDDLKQKKSEAEKQQVVITAEGQEVN